MFIKHADGNIVSVIDEEELTDMQKKLAKDLSKKNSKDGKTSFTVKKSEN